MIPRIELYSHVERDWLGEDLIENFSEALNALLQDLLATPPGPDHVLSQLSVVEISVVDDATIAAVHAEYLGDPTATDAITFPYGEIIVSCDTAEHYALEHDIGREEELFRYMVHGLTHLQGYLDYEPADREALFAIQEPLVERYFPIKSLPCDKHAGTMTQDDRVKDRSSLLR